MVLKSMIIIQLWKLSGFDKISFSNDIFVLDGDQSVSARDKIFREIGYADELGPGMRNTNKYTKLYSGGTPVFIEDNIFEIVIPIDNVAGLQVGPEETDKETDKATAYRIIEILETRPEMSVNKIAEMLELSASGVRYHINKMKKAGIFRTYWLYEERKVGCAQIKFI